MIALLSIGVAGAVLFFLGRTVIAAIRQSGADEERARTAVKRAETDRAQAEIIAQPKTINETISDLDRGVF